LLKEAEAEKTNTAFQTFHIFSHINENKNGGMNRKTWMN